MAVFDQSKAEGCGQMRLSRAGRPETQKIGPFIQPGVAGGQRLDLRLGDHRHGGEVEGVEGLARRQSGLFEMALEAAAAALDHLLFGQRGEEAGGGPALFVGRRGERGPDELDARQPQLAQQKVDASGVDFSLGRSHAASPRTHVIAS